MFARFDERVAAPRKEKADREALETRLTAVVYVCTAQRVRIRGCASSCPSAGSQKRQRSCPHRTPDVRDDYRETILEQSMYMRICFFMPRRDTHEACSGNPGQHQYEENAQNPGQLWDWVSELGWPGMTIININPQWFRLESIEHAHRVDMVLSLVAGIYHSDEVCGRAPVVYCRHRRPGEVRRQENVSPRNLREGACFPCALLTLDVGSTYSNSRD